MYGDAVAPFEFERRIIATSIAAANQGFVCIDDRFVGKGPFFRKNIVSQAEEQPDKPAASAD